MIQAVFDHLCQSELPKTHDKQEQRVKTSKSDKQELLSKAERPSISTASAATAQQVLKLKFAQRVRRDFDEKESTAWDIALRYEAITLRDHTKVWHHIILSEQVLTASSEQPVRSKENYVEGQTVSISPLAELLSHQNYIHPQSQIHVEQLNILTSHLRQSWQNATPNPPS